MQSSEHEENLRRMKELARKAQKETAGEGDDPLDWVMMKRALHFKRMETLDKCIDRGLWDKDWGLWENEVAVQHGEPDETK